MTKINFKPKEKKHYSLFSLKYILPSETWQVGKWNSLLKQALLIYNITFTKVSREKKREHRKLEEDLENKMKLNTKEKVTSRPRRMVGKIFSVKTQMVNIFCFVGYNVFVAPNQFYHARYVNK